MMNHNMLRMKSCACRKFMRIVLCKKIRYFSVPDGNGISYPKGLIWAALLHGSQRPVQYGTYSTLSDADTLDFTYA